MSGGPMSTTPARRRRRSVRLSTGDRIIIAIMIAIPLIVDLALVWVPTFSTIALSFTKWDGIGGLGTIEWTGLTNYKQIFTIYPPFLPALRHNIIWLVVFLIGPTVFGLLLAYLLDKNIRGSRLYQSALYLPVVLSLAVVGFMWQLIYSPDEGLINALLGRTTTETQIDFLGKPGLNLAAILVAAAWKHTGYIMVLYLAGLKSIDPSLREAAQIDGASEWQAFHSVVFPAMRPINIVVLVVTVIESFRAFDIVYIVNRGRNGLELLSVLVTDNIIGEASRIGYGSAIGVILLLLCVTFIVIYLTNAFKDLDQA